MEKARLESKPGGTIRDVMDIVADEKEFWKRGGVFCE